MKRCSAVALLVLSSCEVSPARWGLDAIDRMSTPADFDLTRPGFCGQDLSAAVSPDSTTCTHAAGAHPAESLGLTAEVAGTLPIRHVIVMMKENRSFDHLFGALSQLLPAVEAVPAGFANPDLTGASVAPFHADTTCINVDPGHQSSSMRAAINSGAMDGFVKNAAISTGTDGHFAMSQYDQTDLPFDYWLASTFAVSDHHFAPMVSGTFGDRNFMMFGTNAGVVDTGISYPNPATNSIFRTLMNAGFTWGVYTDSEPVEGTLNWTSSYPGVHSLQALRDALDQGTLPNVVFVDGVENVDDDHPTADVQAGEAWTRDLYQHAIASPQWPQLAIIWTYDEGGGFADHLAPPTFCAAEPGSPFKDLGVRVPLVAISPWARRGYVSKVAHDHTAITRFIELLFDLPALTARDANSDALLDLFDFSCNPDGGTAPLDVPAAPAAGTGGCHK